MNQRDDAFDALARLCDEPGLNGLGRREVLGNHRWQSSQSRMEFGLGFSSRSWKANNLGLLTRMATESVSSSAQMKS